MISPLFLSKEAHFICQNQQYNCRGLSLAQNFNIVIPLTSFHCRHIGKKRRDTRAPAVRDRFLGPHLSSYALRINAMWMGRGKEPYQEQRGISPPAAAHHLTERPNGSADDNDDATERHASSRLHFYCLWVLGL